MREEASGELSGQIERLFHREQPFYIVAQELCRLLRKSVPHYNWVGIYMLEEAGNTLVLRAWDGPAATEHVRIPIGQGICGLAAKEQRTIVVDDVRKDSRYLQCFLHTRSEIVVPILANGKVVGEIDIDSDRIGAFTDDDRDLLEHCAGWLAISLSGSSTFEQDYKAIREGAALQFVFAGILELKGRDRVRFLHNLCTNDIYKLATGKDGVTLGKSPKIDLNRTCSGHGCYAATLTRQGKMIAAYKVWMFEDRLRLEVPREAMAPLKAEFEKSIVMDQVEVCDVSNIIHYYLVGPRMRNMTPAEVPEFHFLERDGMQISPFRLTGEEGFDVIVPAARAGQVMLQLCSKATLIGEEALDAARIENGWPRWGVDMGPGDLPMEAGLEPVAISYSKGCYVGQEVIQRMKTYGELPRRLVSLEIEGNLPPVPGSAVTSGGAEVGRVTSSAMASRPVALGTVKKTHYAPGTPVDVGGVKAVVQDLPWHRSSNRRS